MAWHWLIENLQQSLGTPWLQMVLVLASVVCGGIVGAERERREKPAGLRTLILVSLGSTAFTMASYAFVTTTGDSGRVSAQIVTGIGFLGAGAILHSSGAVRGMTTAATIWATAATGMVVGIGYVGAGLGLSILVRLILSLALKLESQALGAERETRIELVFETDGGKARALIERIMEDYHLHSRLEPEQSTSEGRARVSFPCQLPRRHRRHFLSEIARLPQVKELKAVDVSAAATSP